MSVFVDTSANFHPYECDGPGKCVHCDRLVVVRSSDEGTSYYEHHPMDCALCAETAPTEDGDSHRNEVGQSAPQ